ncbi:MAG: nitrate reductase molybdenum cofactor assembly chaperone [Burkholderiales bacterium]|nr:nitrate reductase molybdenum cofactor assembly chaperone [Burkholderiales bacterium]
MKHRDFCRVLAALLSYPDQRLRTAMAELGDALSDVRGDMPQLPALIKDQLLALTQNLGQGDPYEVEERYVQCFDRGRATSLYMFEHVHGDSRDRGPAMVDLAQTYEQAGMFLGDGELPDYLPVALEFASTQPERVARDFLSEMGHILNTIHTALVERESPYAAVLAATLWLAGVPVQALVLPKEESMDEAWQEPDAFGGCSSEGQAKPDQPQPIHIVRNAKPRPGAAA